jgi:hypothetical protein
LENGDSGSLMHRLQEVSRLLDAYMRGIEAHR